MHQIYCFVTTVTLKIKLNLYLHSTHINSLNNLGLIVNKTRKFNTIFKICYASLHNLHQLWLKISLNNFFFSCFITSFHSLHIRQMLENICDICISNICTLLGRNRELQPVWQLFPFTVGGASYNNNSRDVFDLLKLI